MAGLTDYMESTVLGLLFANTNIANLGDATGLRGSTAAGSLYVALFTATPTDVAATGTEAAYTGYARVADARGTGTWTQSGTTQIANSTTITFPACTAGSSTVVAFGLYDAPTGGNLLLYGPASLAISTGITPAFAVGALVVTLD